MSNKKEGMTAIIIPQEHLDFLQRNPKVAQTVGKIFESMNECKLFLKQFDQILQTPQIFAGEVENGTFEELTAFLKTLYENQDRAINIDDITSDEIDQVVNQFGAQAVKTYV